MMKELFMIGYDIGNKVGLNIGVACRQQCHVSGHRLEASTQI